MKTIGIFYGSSTGTTEGIAKRIAEKLGVKTKIFMTYLTLLPLM